MSHCAFITSFHTIYTLQNKLGLNDEIDKPERKQADETTITSVLNVGLLARLIFSEDNKRSSVAFSFTVS